MQKDKRKEILLFVFQLTSLPGCFYTFKNPPILARITDNVIECVRLEMPLCQILSLEIEKIET